MEDESINLISNDYERETAKLRTEHRRQIEDLREKLRTEKNLNKTARESINRQTKMLDTAFQRAQLQLIQKHNQDEEAANNERTLMLKLERMQKIIINQKLLYIATLLKRLYETK